MPGDLLAARFGQSAIQPHLGGPSDGALQESAPDVTKSQALGGYVSNEQAILRMDSAHVPGGATLPTRDPPVHARGSRKSVDEMHGLQRETKSSEEFQVTSEGQLPGRGAPAPTVTMNPHGASWQPHSQPRKDMAGPDDPREAPLTTGKQRKDEAGPAEGLTAAGRRTSQYHCSWGMNHPDRQGMALPITIKANPP